LPKALHPHYQEVLHTLVPADFKTVPFHTATGQMDEDSLAQALDDKTAALVLPLPNFFGVIEDVHRLTNLAHARGALLVALVNPLSLALFAPPGQWGEKVLTLLWATGSLWVCLCRLVVHTLALWRQKWPTCAKCQGALLAAPKTWKVKMVSF